ncbi:MAG: nitroreductase family protein, partial [Betaproteobacteria bacterium]|nr:nitroreductase family protein [Betaproteobacteria bacterium]
MKKEPPEASGLDMPNPKPTTPDAQVRRILDQLAERFSCRDFDGTLIDSAELEQIVADGVEAPSSCNQQNWHFIIVT